ncbi:Glutamate receptor ionotropic, kainate 4 [Collichthys lucidus]|uniref:Glutamate receptor ionotropic, kainate 4 n=1 Tax=Collichthys lucidus TaxID=240159 RepID=A0A4V6AQM1_COLLU|nr:Glutamate receptor ionotropic, kainate 4 [Collichthys lucidus]
MCISKSTILFITKQSLDLIPEMRASKDRDFQGPDAGSLPPQIEIWLHGLRFWDELRMEIVDTQGLHYTLMGRDGKPIEGVWGRGGKQRMGSENHTDRQSAMMKRLPFLFPLSDQHVLPHPLQAPLRTAAMPGLADRPATLFRTLPASAVSHGSMYRFTSSREELKQRWIGTSWVAPHVMWAVTFCKWKWTHIKMRAHTMHPTRNHMHAAPAPSGSVLQRCTFISQVTGAAVEEADLTGWRHRQANKKQPGVMSHECTDTGSQETLSVRMLDDSQDPTPLLKEIRDDKTATIIVDANATMSHIILERASELGMLSVYYTYIFTSLFPKLNHTLTTIDCSPLVTVATFSCGVHSDNKGIFLMSALMSGQKVVQEFPLLRLDDVADKRLSSALLFDAVYAVVAAVQELNRSQNVGATQLSCKSSKIWEHGTSLMNYLRMVELEGLTGHIEFNSKGQRSNYALRIMQNSKDGLRQHLQTLRWSRAVIGSKTLR